MYIFFSRDNDVKEIKLFERLNARRKKLKRETSLLEWREIWQRLEHTYHFPKMISISCYSSLILPFLHDWRQTQLILYTM